MRNADIKELWVEHLKWVRDVDAGGGPYVDDPPWLKCGEVLGLLQEIDRLRKKCGLKPLKPKVKP